MTPDLTLHYAPDNASLCVRLLLDEMGTPYRTELVDRSVRAQKSESYLKINPNGLIPTLETPNGPIFETAAILLWLADHTPGTVFPATTDPARGSALATLFWLSNTLH
ncbi:glutathione S-transferase N-terminal domain-containing protein, partial [Yoonia sp.]|uniref:glutathione S-transferase family protein n=1 Tax=Yoonia sp. TaxID=2212373 RepID=UPI0023874F72